MCGRFAFYADPETVREHFAIENSVVLTPRYNIAPSQPIPIIRCKNQLDFLTWGFRPAWLKPDQNAFINARMETLQERPAFKQAFKKRRCLILANGYYEWKIVHNVKQPYFISLPQEKIFAFAGVWEQDTCAIITRVAYQHDVAAIHARMPVIVTPKYYDLWLDPKANAISLQQCMLDESLHHIIAPVSTKVNNPKNDFVECIAPLQ